jgi:hypothetical protein
MTATRPLGLTYDEYWTKPWKNLTKFARDAMLNSKPAFVVDVPEYFVPGSKDTLPLLVVRAGDKEVLARAPFERAGVVACMDLGSNVLRANKALTRDQPPAAAEEKVAPGSAVREYKADLLKTGTVDLDSPGEYLVAVIVREQVSNRVALKIGAPEQAFKDEEVARFLAAERAKLPAMSVRPEEGSDGVTYGEAAGCPPVPSKEGIALAGAQVAPGKDGWGMISGSFRLPLLPNDVVTSPERHPAGVKKKVGKACTGVVGVSLLFLAADDSAPLVIRLNVPVFSKVETDAGRQVATGHFRFDLLSNEGVQARPQSGWVYAFSSEHMAGPVVVGVGERKP